MKELPLTVYVEEGRRYVLCGSQYKRGHDEAALEGILQWGLKALEEVKRYFMFFVKLVDTIYITEACDTIYVGVDFVFINARKTRDSNL